MKPKLTNYKCLSASFMLHLSVYTQMIHDVLQEHDLTESTKVGLN